PIKKYVSEYNEDEKIEWYVQWKKNNL
ncbi:uncharacterized protein METZ01_LOCUS394570, partial [marine metagenome]